MNIEALQGIDDMLLLDELIERIGVRMEKDDADPRWEYVLADLNEAATNAVWG